MKHTQLKDLMFDNIWGRLYDSLSVELDPDTITLIRENLEYDALMYTKYGIRTLLSKGEP